MGEYTLERIASALERIASALDRIDLAQLERAAGWPDRVAGLHDSSWRADLLERLQVHRRRRRAAAARHGFAEE